MSFKKYLYNLATDRSNGFGAGVMKILLFLLSLVYGLIIRMLILFQGLNRRSLRCKVISVGNITLGGTGKTCLVEFIAGYLKERGRSAAIISRGYKRRPAGNPEDNKQYAAMGDEPFMLQSNLKDTPVIVDADRARAAAFAIGKYGADTVILDDGFQQWKIKKDLEIVTVDSVNPFGNRQMIPRGILREPLSSLKRADIFVLTNTNLNAGARQIAGYLSGINKDALIVESIHEPAGFYAFRAQDKLLSVKTLESKPVLLFSGIGNPDSFENAVKGLGIKINASLRFPDHHSYSDEELDNIVKEAKESGALALITTQKDTARISALPEREYGLPVFVLKVRLKIIKNEQGFYNRLLGLYSV
ncbi:MAG: tetraacyldisaccharide 4'-kinase [Candidatus Omnitrophica bacterium]|nr:tetraacyldisaccharide 4'-kinase [Candidatus Omnitrophota bacterium]